MNKIAWGIALVLLGFALGYRVPLHAEYNQGFISSVTVQSLMPATEPTIVAGGTYPTRAFLALERTINQSVAVKGTGTSPNYKVELLTSLTPDDSTSFVKPEVGGDLGTFTDQNWHMIPLGGPVALAHKLQFTELGAVNSLVPSALEASQ